MWDRFKFAVITISIVILAIVASALWHSARGHGMVCQNPDALSARLKDFNGQLIAFGRLYPSACQAILMTSADGTWILFSQCPEGLACTIAQGDKFTIDALSDSLANFNPNSHLGHLQ